MILKFLFPICRKKERRLFKKGGRVKRSTLLLGLVLIIFVNSPVLSREDKSESEIISGVTEFFNSYASGDIEGVLKWVSPYSTQLRAELKKDIENIQKIEKFSCGNTKLIRYKYKGNSKLKVEVMIECSGFNPETSSEFKQEITKQARLIKDEDGAWKVVEVKDFDINKEKRSFFPN